MGLLEGGISSEILHKIEDERSKQQEKYKDDRDLEDGFWYLIFAEEVGEVAKAILEHDQENLEVELVQSIAVGIAWLEDRKIQKEKTKEYAKLWDEKHGRKN